MTAQKQVFYPPIVLTHAIAFSAGAMTLVAGLLDAKQPYWFLIAGSCFVASGLLIMLGSHVTFGGAAGRTLRAVLGPARVARVNGRALLFILAGLLATAWGIEVLGARREAAPPAPAPDVASESTH